MFITENDLEDLAQILADQIQARIGPGSPGQIIHHEELRRIKDGVSKIINDLSIEIKKDPP